MNDEAPTPTTPEQVQEQESEPEEQPFDRWLISDLQPDKENEE